MNVGRRQPVGGVSIAGDNTDHLFMVGLGACKDCLLHCSPLACKYEAAVVLKPYLVYDTWRLPSVGGKSNAPEARVPPRVQYAYTVYLVLGSSWYRRNPKRENSVLFAACKD